MYSPFFEPLHPAAGMLAKTRLEILIVPDRAPHEVYALRLGTDGA